MKSRWVNKDGINHEKYKYNIQQLFSRNPLTASISLRAFHCSYWTPRASAVWMVLFIWLVHTFRSRIFWPLMKAAKAFAYWKLKQERLSGAFTEIGLESDVVYCFHSPSVLGVTGLNLPQYILIDWVRSLRGGSDRWISAWHECSLDSRLSCFECGPGRGSPGTCCPRRKS